VKSGHQPVLEYETESRESSVVNSKALEFSYIISIPTIVLTFLRHLEVDFCYGGVFSGKKAIFLPPKSPSEIFVPHPKNGDLQGSQRTESAHTKAPVAIFLAISPSLGIEGSFTT